MRRAIPAHAGNTYRQRAPPRHGPGHPRACGEHISKTRMAAVPNGPSPRMRGTHIASERGCHIAGAIPAHAGNTRRPAARRGGLSGHPRACGEHGASRARTSRSVGPSPRMRGTRPVCLQDLRWRRAIPAHAGNTCTGFAAGAHSRGHPRACGEHSPCTRTVLWPSGPSPRMRGTPGAGARGGSGVGAIPAHAGNTSTWAVNSSSSAGHPRACGEHPMSATTSKTYGGPSPRMRGTRLHRQHVGRS